MTISYVSAPNKRTAVSQTFNPVDYEGTTVYMDPYANYTTLLLKGNGTNGVVNNNFQDSSSNSYAITRGGNTTQGSFSPYASNWSSYINGSSYLNVGTTRFLDASAWTVEMWVNTTNTANFVTLCAQYTASGGGFSVRTVLGINSSSGTAAIFQGGSLQSGITNVCDGRWHHVAFVLSSGTVKLYVDGTNEATFSGFSTPHTTTTLFFYDSYNSTSYYTGYASNLRVTNTAVYSANFTVPTTALTAISGTQLLTLQSNRYIDNSTNAYTVAVNGTPSIQKFNPFTPTAAYTASVTGGSGYFDGSGDYLSMTSSPIGSSGTFTFECWVYTPSISSAAWLYTQRQSVSANRFGIVIVPDSTGYHLEVSSGSNPGVLSTADGMRYNTWNHVAAVRDGSNNVKLFINGVLDTTYAGWSYSIEQSAGRIGFLGNSGTQYFTGYITDTRITNTAVYSATFSVPTAPLTAISGTQLLINYLNAGIYDETIATMLETAGNTSVSTGTKKYGSGSIYFDGTGDYLISPALQSNAFGTGDLTFECWIYATTASDSPIYESRSTNSNTDGFTVTAYSSTVIRVYTTAVLVTATVSDYVNKWTHVAYTRQSGTNRLFVNGILVATATATDNFTNTTTIIGGGRYATSSVSAYFTGYIDDLRVTKGIARYTTNFTPPQAELPFFGAVKSYNSDAIDLGGVDFPVFKYNTLLLKGDGTNGAQNNTFLDSSSNNFTITRNGNTTQGTFTPYRANGYWSMYSADGYMTASMGTNGQFGTGDFCVECWLYPFAGTTGSGDVIWSFANYPATNGVYLSYTSAGQLNVFSASATRITGSSNMTMSAWNHVAVTRSSGTTYLYLNGVQIGSSASVANLTEGFTYFGRANDVASYYYKGYVSNFRVVKGSAVYSGNFTPPTTPLTAISGTQLLAFQSNRFIDNSSNAYALTISGSYSVQAFQPFAPAEYTPSTLGGSGYFDGSGDYLSSPNINFSTNNFTIEGWFYPTTIANTTNFWGTDNGSGSNPKMIMYIDSSGNLTVDLGSAGTTQFPVSASASTYLKINTWNHIAVVRSGLGSGQLALYINGSSVSTGQLGTNISSITAAFNVGYIGEAYGNPFSGYISDFRIVNGTAVYTTAFTPPSAPLTAITNTSLLQSFTNPGIYDNVMMTDLETVGNAQISTSVKKYGTGSMYFDGAGDYLVPSAPVSNLNLVLGTGDFTIEFWVYFIGGLGSDIVLYDSRPLSTNGAYPTIYVNSSSQLSYVVSSTDRITSSTAFTTSTWYHVAVCRNASVTRMFINGVQVGTSYSDTTTYLNPARRPVIAINGYNETAAPLNGYIDDLRVTKGFARYTMNFIPPTATFPTS